MIDAGNMGRHCRGVPGRASWLLCAGKGEPARLGRALASVVAALDAAAAASPAPAEMRW